jgi:hypothetical protein
LEKLKGNVFFVKNELSLTLFICRPVKLCLGQQKLNPTGSTGCQVKNVNFDPLVSMDTPMNKQCMVMQFKKKVVVTSHSVAVKLKG